MTTTPDPYATWAAAHVLGALEPDERSEFVQHLEACESCRAEVSELASIPGLLARLTDADLESAIDPTLAQQIETAAANELADLRRGRRRWRTTALALAAAVALLVGVAGLSQLRSGGNGHTLDLAIMQADHATLVVNEQPWGTEIKLDASGLKPIDRYVMWVIDQDGSWESVVAWDNPGTGLTHLITASHTPMHSIDRIVVTDTDRTVTLLEAHA